MELPDRRRRRRGPGRAHGRRRPDRRVGRRTPRLDAGHRRGRPGRLRPHGRAARRAVPRPGRGPGLLHRRRRPGRLPGRRRHHVARREPGRLPAHRPGVGSGPHQLVGGAPVRGPHRPEQRGVPRRRPEVGHDGRPRRQRRPRAGARHPRGDRALAGRRRAGLRARQPRPRGRQDDLVQRDRLGASGVCATTSPTSSATTPRRCTRPSRAAAASRSARTTCAGTTRS